MISGSNNSHIDTRTSQPNTINFLSFRWITRSFGNFLTSDLIRLHWEQPSWGCAGCMTSCVLCSVADGCVCLRACVCVWSGFGNTFYRNSSVAGSISRSADRTSKGFRVWLGQLLCHIIPSKGSGNFTQPRYLYFYCKPYLRVLHSEYFHRNCAVQWLKLVMEKRCVWWEVQTEF
jgi:hypothetical protein